MKITIHYALWQCKYYYMEMLNRLYRLPLRTQANKRSRISLCGAAMARSLPNVIGNRIKFTVILSGRSHIFYFISLNWQTTSQRRRTNAPEKMRRWRRGNRRRRRKKWDKCEMRSEKQCMLLLKCHCYSHRRNKMRRNAVCLYITVSITLCRVAAEKWRQRKMCVWGHRVWCARTRKIFAICCVCVRQEVFNTFMGKRCAHIPHSNTQIEANRMWSAGWWCQTVSRRKIAKRKKLHGIVRVTCVH